MSTKTIPGNSQFQKPIFTFRMVMRIPGGQFLNEMDHLIFNPKCIQPPQILHGIGPPPPSREVPYFA
ncbi:unnamed protein product [Heligmosomoides polygyrus]|uniref:Uncharacterized protein n=1 Tax=Heligmosomoides polygyrus TaxID=6339 RepID=A0A183GWT7_HELPZ|nr:unnamed protein product [Heligmosomoides polygyrus]